MSRPLLFTAIISVLLPSAASSQGTFGTLVLIETEPVPSGPSPLSAHRPPEWRFVELVYAPLFGQNALGQYEPYLAGKIELQDGGRSVVVTLRDDAKWSVGRDLNPRDVVYTYTLAQQGKWNNAWIDLLRPLDKVEVHDNGFDVVFRFKIPLAQPHALLTVPLIPSGLHGPLDDTSRQRPLPLGAIGAGPYTPAGEQQFDKLVVNEHCLRKPRISEVHILTAGSRRLAADFVRLMGDAVTFDVAPEDATMLQEEFGAKVIETERRRLVALAYQGTQTPLGDATVRRSSDYPRAFRSPAFDPLEAEKLLWWDGGWQREPDQPWFVRKNDKGATDTLGFSMLLDADDRESMRRGYVLQERARRAGFELKLDPRPRHEFESRVRSREFPAALVTLDMFGRNPLRSLFHSKGGENVLNFSDPDVDKAIDTGDRKKAAELLANKKPMLFLGVTRDLGVAGKNVNIPRLSGRGGMERVDKWRIR